MNDVLGVKIKNSVENFWKDGERKSIKECTQMWWKCSKKKRENIKYIVGIKNGVIYSAFEVIGVKEVENSEYKERIGRTVFECGESLDDIVGAKIEAKNRSALKYYDSKDFFENLKKDEAMKKYIMSYYKKRGILYK